MMDFNATVEIHESQHSANRGMLDLIDRMTIFDLRIHDTDLVVEEWGKEPTGQITVLVNRSGKYRTAVLAVPGRVVGASTKEGNSIWSSADDHSSSSSSVVVNGPWHQSIPFQE